MAVQAFERSYDEQRSKSNQGAKVFLFIVGTVLLVTIHLGVFSQTAMFDDFAIWLTKRTFGVSLYAGVVVFALFMLIFAVVCVSSREFKRDPEVHNIIYYLGFMSTLLSLIISSYTLLDGSQPGARNPTDLVAQNGLALVATFSGIFFRNMLRYCFPPRPESLTARWEDLKRTMSSVDEGLKALTTQAEQFQKVFAGASSQIESGKAQWEQVTAIAGAMDQTFQASSDTVQRLNGTLSQSAAINQQLANTVAQSAQTVRALSAEVDRLNQRIGGPGPRAAGLNDDIPPLRAAARGRR